MLIDSITAICVVYRTKDLVQKAIESFRGFYPDVPLVVVDNSAREGECTKYLQELTKQDKNTSIFVMPENVGHGPGMDYALNRITTDWAYIFDSDTEMLKPGIFEAFKVVAGYKKILAAGHRLMVSVAGRMGKQTKAKADVPYIHPAVCFINRQLYLSYPPFRYHGAPCIDTYAKVDKQGLSDELLFQFPIEMFVKHEWRGTRSFHKMKPWVD